MESKNAAFLRQGLVDRYRKMSPGERVKAFIEHSRQMQQLRKAGEIRRAAMTEARKLRNEGSGKPFGSESINTKPHVIKDELGLGKENG